MKLIMLGTKTVKQVQKFGKKGGFYSSLPLIGAILLFIALSVIALVLGFMLQNADKIPVGAVESVTTMAVLNDIAKLEPELKSVSSALDSQTFIIDKDLGILSKTLYGIVSIDPKNNIALYRYDLEGYLVSQTINGLNPLKSSIAILQLPNTIVVLKTENPNARWSALDIPPESTTNSGTY